MVALNCNVNSVHFVCLAVTLFKLSICIRRTSSRYRYNVPIVPRLKPIDRIQLTHWLQTHRQMPLILTVRELRKWLLLPTVYEVHALYVRALADRRQAIKM